MAAADHPQLSISAEKQGQSRLFLVCVPRSVSTSVTKCLSVNTRESDVWFEPYVTCRHAGIEFQRQTGRKLAPDYEGHEADYKIAARYMSQQVSQDAAVTFESTLLSYSVVKSRLENNTNRCVIVKDFGLALSGLEQYLPSLESGYRYVFLIRDPFRSVSSYRKAAVAFEKRYHGLTDESTFDLSYDRFYPGGGKAFRFQHDTWRHVLVHLDPNALIIDTEDLLAHPAACLKKICEVSGLVYSDAFLRWESSPDVVMRWNNPGIQQMMDGELSDFHGQALRSTCFVTSRSKARDSDMTPDVLKIADEAMPYYKDMYQERFVPF